jgi:hypothetical protein
MEALSSDEFQKPSQIVLQRFAAIDRTENITNESRDNIVMGSPMLYITRHIRKLSRSILTCCPSIKRCGINQ